MSRAQAALARVANSLTGASAAEGIQLPPAVAEFLHVPKEVFTTYLHARTALRWAYLSAADPGGVPLDDDENAARNRAVGLYVRQLGYQAVWHENSDCPSWLPAGGILIIGIPRAAAEHLGNELGQNAIVAGELGELGDLVYRL